MAVTTTARSVVDATRFTPTTPHASSTPSGSMAAAPSRQGPSPARPGGATASNLPPRRGPAPGPMTETPEERVRRLRAAHLAARNAQISRFDRIVERSRGVLDTAHRVTIMALLGFTAIAGLVTVYTFVDMVRFNKMRKAEFAEAQKKLRADSLEAARIAYVTGTATEEQMRLIEEAAERSAAAAEVSGLGSEGKTGFKLPPILGPPMAAKRTTRETLSDGKSGAGKEGENATQVVATSSASAAAGGFWTTDDAAASTPATGTTAEPPKKSSVGFFGSLFGPWSTKQPTGQQQKPVDGAGSPSGRAQQQSTAEPAQSNGGEKKKGWW